MTDIRINFIFSVIKQFAKQYRTPQQFNYTKFYTKSTTIYGFPTFMGFPGVFAQHTPVLLKLNGSLALLTVPDVSKDPRYLPRIVDVSMKLRLV